MCQPPGGTIERARPRPRCVRTRPAPWYPGLLLLLLAGVLGPAAAFFVQRPCAPPAHGARAARAMSAVEGGAAGAAAPKPGEVLELMKVCGQLKRTARTGWVR